MKHANRRQQLEPMQIIALGGSPAYALRALRHIVGSRATSCRTDGRSGAPAGTRRASDGCVFNTTQRQYPLI